MQKWDQRAWDVYFPIIFAYHIGAISMIIVYIPYIFSAVIGFLHFAAFVALVILNIFIKDAEPGNGSRTKGSRVVWGRNHNITQSCVFSTSCFWLEDSVELLMYIHDHFTVFILSINTINQIFQTRFNRANSSNQQKMKQKTKSRILKSFTHSVLATPIFLSPPFLSFSG